MGKINEKYYLYMMQLVLVFVLLSGYIFCCADVTKVDFIIITCIITCITIIAVIL